jgi:thiamine biosynthesis lipoprotein
MALTLQAWIVAASLAWGGDEPTLKRFEFTETQMGVPFKITLYAPDEPAANQPAKAAYARIAELNRVMSDYDAASEISKLSACSPCRRQVSGDLWRVLQRSQALAEQSQGAFDVTVGPYVRLWRRSRRLQELPTEKRLSEARAAFGYENLKLHNDDQSAELLKPHMRIDLGGIAMGYAVDEAQKVLKAHGVTRAMVDGSGDIGVSGPPPGKAAWRIGVAPLAGDADPSRYVDLVDAAITTSGDAFQHVDIDGQRYSHIVDPQTGLGLTTRAAATVIAGDCITADSVATAVCVLGPEKGIELVETIPHAAAIVVQDNGAAPQAHLSKRFESYLAK